MQHKNNVNDSTNNGANEEQLQHGARKQSKYRYTVARSQRPKKTKLNGACSLVHRQHLKYNFMVTQSRTNYSNTHEYTVCYLQEGSEDLRVLQLHGGEHLQLLPLTRGHVSCLW